MCVWMEQRGLAYRGAQGATFAAPVAATHVPAAPQARPRRRPLSAAHPPPPRAAVPACSCPHLAAFAHPATARASRGRAAASPPPAAAPAPARTRVPPLQKGEEGVTRRSEGRGGLVSDSLCTGTRTQPLHLPLLGLRLLRRLQRLRLGGVRASRKGVVLLAQPAHTSPQAAHVHGQRLAPPLERQDRRGGVLLLVRARFPLRRRPSPGTCSAGAGRGHALPPPLCRTGRARLWSPGPRGWRRW